MAVAARISGDLAESRFWAQLPATLAHIKRMHEFVTQQQHQQQQAGSSPGGSPTAAQSAMGQAGEAAGAEAGEAAAGSNPLVQALDRDAEGYDRLFAAAQGPAGGVGRWSGQGGAFVGNHWCQLWVREGCACTACGCFRKAVRSGLLRMLLPCCCRRPQTPQSGRRGGRQAGCAPAGACSARDQAGTRRQWWVAWPKPMPCCIERIDHLYHERIRLLCMLSAKAARPCTGKQASVSPPAVPPSLLQACRAPRPLPCRLSACGMSSCAWQRHRSGRCGMRP